MAGIGLLAVVLILLLYLPLTFDALKILSHPILYGYAWEKFGRDR